MGYKILYIEDLEPGTIIHELESQGFNVQHHQPVLFEDTITAVEGVDLLLIDFRLTDKTAKFDAPTIAQNLRTVNSSSHKDIPIVLISTERNIKDYYRDMTSKDLFDISLTKEDLLTNIEKYSMRFVSIIEAYQAIKSAKFDVKDSLKIPGELINSIDYRIFERLNNEVYKNDVFAFSNFILKNIVSATGVLIGEDVLSARLGVSKNIADWKKLLSLFDEFKYKGVFSNSYNRWWNEGFMEWWKTRIDNNHSPRRLNAEQRVKILIDQTGLKLEPQVKTKYAKSTSFWTICKETNLPIDPIDGLELYKKDLYPWQDIEYLSIQAGLEPTKFDSDTGQPTFLKFLKPIDKRRLYEIGKS